QKDQDLGSGDIKAGQWVTVVYDGTNWQMVSPPAQVDAPSVPAVSHDLQVVKGGTPASQMDRQVRPLTESNLPILPIIRLYLSSLAMALSKWLTSRQAGR
ncbi:MAG: hypothetical protein ACPGQU_06590, partial [Candidatus Puniceispirillaceae bacterium]